MTARPTWDDFRQLRFSAGGYLLTREFSQRIGAALAYGGLRAGVSPSALTWIGLALNIAASTVFALAPLTVAPALASMLLYQLAYGFDCADGQLARGAGLASAFGAWLDLALDYARCILIASASLLVLVNGHGLPLEHALIAAAALLTGMVLSAHTSMVLRNVPARSAPVGTSSWIAGAVRIAVDTPTVLLLLGLLRNSAAGLSVYCVLMGVAECAIAGFAAHRRLRSQ